MVDNLKKKKLVTIIAGGTGGHIYPSIGIINKLKKNFNLCFITDERGYNFLLKNNINYKHNDIDFFRYDISSPFKQGFKNKMKFLILFFISLIKILIFLFKNKPYFQIGFGGYTTVLPCLIGKLLFKINFYIHEQNVIMGRANRFLEKFTLKSFISFENTYPTRFVEKRIYCGTPIRKEINLRKNNHIKSNKLNILILGGSLGSNFFSNSLVKCIVKLDESYLKKIFLYHQVVNDLVDNVKSIYKKNNVPSEVKNFFFNIEYYYAKADLVICRSGGSTIAEILQLKIPSIIIPLSQALDDHQKLNSNIIKDNDLGSVIDEVNFNEKVFINLITDIIDNEGLLKNIKLHFQKFTKKNNKLKNFQTSEEIIFKNLISNDSS